MDRVEYLQIINRLEEKVENPNEGFFGPNSLVWHVNKNILPLLMGAGRALLLQIAHPWVRQAVFDHSSVYDDPFGRLQRTALGVQSIIFGNVAQARKTATAIFTIHEKISGKLQYSQGPFEISSRYRANDVDALTWVFATLVESAVTVFERYMRPLSEAEKRHFYEESTKFAGLFGIPLQHCPQSWEDFYQYNQDMWRSEILTVNQASRELMNTLFTSPYPLLVPFMAYFKMITSIELPDIIREKFQLALPRSAPVITRLNRTFIHLAHGFLPDLIRYGPVYEEARLRLKGRGSTLFTRLFNQLIFQKRKVVSL